MCDTVPEPATLDDHALAASIAEHARTENATAGRRLDAIAELAVRRLGSAIGRERERWLIDGWASCAAEVAAELVIGPRAASGLLHQGLNMRYRTPRIGDLLRRGLIPLRVAATVSYRTGLIDDDTLLAKVDADLATIATRFGRYSDTKLIDAIDTRIARHDPDAVRRFRTAEKLMDVRFGKPDDDTGTRSIYGSMSIITADLLSRRIDTLAAAVCGDDPRPIGQRRSEAYGILAVGGDHLPCQCTNPDCPATGPDPRAGHLEILVLTDDPTAGQHPPQDPTPPDDGPGDDDPDPGLRDPDSGRDFSAHWPDPDHPTPDTEPESEPESVAPEPDSDTAPAARPAPCNYTSITTGGATVPPPLLHQLRLMGAAVRTVTAAEVTAEARYRPSAAHRRLVRTRDMTCCFIGCNKPAQYCDVDHTRPYASSLLTHPANTKCLCRQHHLLKSFWIGNGGWTDRQEPDGTIVWTTPSGRQHRAPPGSRLHFPDWDTTTPIPADTPPPTNKPPTPGRELRMPQRKRTRAQQHTANIKAERDYNRSLDAAHPPPF